MREVIIAIFLLTILNFLIVVCLAMFDSMDYIDAWDDEESEDEQDL